uniref:Si:ch211-163l21.8 n=1 Tax=Neogobius melanostomus TaxID=47308 RepID=A0A8C6TEK6_9GOBI
MWSKPCGGFYGDLIRVNLSPVSVSLQSDYHFEYTECDVLGARWRVAVPNKLDTCTGLPDPVKGTQCSTEFLDMQSQECRKCAAGTYSLGTGVAFDEWDSLPHGFVTLHHNTNEYEDQISCANTTWTPKGEYIASNTDECTATLSYAVNLKKPGVLTFEYFYPDDNVYFEFFVQNDQCQSTDSQSRWMKVSENDWSKHMVELNKGNNVLYWRTTGFSLDITKPVLLKNIGISGVAYTSECFLCKPGTYSAKTGTARCSPCPADTFSTKGATVCHPCNNGTFAEASSGTCKPRPACTNSDYFYTHTPCDAEGKTQLMYKWIEPKICSETVEGAVQLPASGEKQTCPPCNPGFYVTNSSTCEPCQHGFYSNGTVCDRCPAGTEPLLGYEYKWWNTMPKNLKSTTFRRDNTGKSMTAWEVAGEYIYTTPGEEDTDFLMLTLNVPGYRLPQSVAQNSEISELSRITFVFETRCTADCRFFFQAGYNQWNTEVVEQWKGTNNKQSYSFVIQANSTSSFTWSFQHTERKYSSDFAKIYYIHISNVIGGVASQCRHCALVSSQTRSGCVPCPVGHYMASETGVCNSCPPNTVIRTGQAVGEAACVPCGPNTKRNKEYSACLSDCHLDVPSQWGMLHYNFSPLSNATDFHSIPRFTAKGLKYFLYFDLGLCGMEGRVPAVCVDNVTESGKKEVKGYICQSTVVPSDIRAQTVVSSQPVVIGDTLVGVTTETTLNNISSPALLFPSTSTLLDVIFYYKSIDKTQTCKQGRAATVRMRCNPTVIFFSFLIIIEIGSNCSEGTCDGCTFHFLWESQNACPFCTKRHYREIISACVQGIQKTTYVWQQPLQCFGGEPLPEQRISACVSLDFWLKFGVSTGTIAALLLIGMSCYFWKKTRKLQYKYSKLIMSSEGKECELPTADSCAIMEGEDAEDEYIDLTKKSFFTKIKSFRSEVGQSQWINQ